MLGQLWHSILLIVAVSYTIFILSATDPCVRSDHAAAPFGMVGDALRNLIHNQTSAENSEAVKSASSEAREWVAGMVADTVYGPGTCHFGAKAQAADLPSEASIPVSTNTATNKNSTPKK